MLTSYLVFSKCTKTLYRWLFCWQIQYVMWFVMNNCVRIKRWKYMTKYVGLYSAGAERTAADESLENITCRTCRPLSTNMGLDK